VGLYFSWMIVLFGAQVAYVFQNRQAYLQDKQAQKVHQRGREFAALRMVTEIARRFALNQPPLAVSTMANRLGIPPRLAGQLLQTLAQDRLLVEAAGNEGAYLPARPLDQITAGDVIEAMRTGQGRQLHTADDPVRSVLKHEYAAIVAVETTRARAVTVAELVHRAELPFSA
jgi:membrane protein